MTVPVQELTYKDVKAAQDWTFLQHRQRAKFLRGRGTRYAGIRGASVFFRTFSSEYEKNGLIYTEEIKLFDLAEALKTADLSLRDRVRLAMAGDIGLHCSCPSFIFWGYAYVLTQLDAISPPPENRFPVIRNPGLRGVVCKHLSLVLEVFGAHWNSVLRDLKRQGYG